MGKLGKKLFLAFVVLVACPLWVQASAGLSPQDLLRHELDSLEPIVDLPEVSLPVLLERNLIVEVVPNVYRFRATTSIIEQEIDAATLLSDRLRCPILLFGRLPGIGDMPGIDAILFSSLGQPTHNISFKSAFRPSNDPHPDIVFYLERILGHASQSLATLNASRVNGSSSFLEPEKRNELRRATFRRLLEQVPGRMRPTMLVLDLMVANNLQIEFEPRPVQHRGLGFLHLSNGDNRQGEMRVVGLNSLLEQSPHLASIVFMRPETISIWRTGEVSIFRDPNAPSARNHRVYQRFTLNPVEYREPSCEERLTRRSTIPL